MAEPIKLRVIFMGTSSFAAHILESLLQEQLNIISVYTQPDKKVGREQETQKSAVRIASEKHGIPVFAPEKLDEAVATEMKSQKPDLTIVAAYGKILPWNIIDLPGFGTINVHASLLPKYRGPSPIQNAILRGEKETGITIMLMNQGIDTGDIISQRGASIGEDEATPELTQKLAQIGAELLWETIPQWIERKIKPQKQDDSKATLCQLIERSDGKIIWTDDAVVIYNRFRAFYPWPGIYTYWELDGIDKRIKLNKISHRKNSPETPHHIGEVFQLGDKIGVQCTSGIILLEEVQMEGKNNMKIEEFLNGYPNFVGSILK